MRIPKVNCRSFIVALSIFAAPFLPAQSVPGPPANVTFDVTLPPDTPDTDTIYVAGDFQGWDPGASPLTRNGLHATGTFTISQLTIEYKFTRGSWDKGEKAADCSEISNRQANVQDGETLSDTVGGWADICGTGGASPIDSRAQKIDINSTSLGVPKSFYVYLPPGYDAQSNHRFPVVYLFRGHESEWVNKNQDSTRGGRDVIDVYEDLLTAGQVGPMIFVFPGISSDDDSVSGMLTNFLAPQLTTAPGIGTGAFHDYFVNEIIPYIDNHYRTIAGRDGRGVDGFSLGGFMSAKIAAQHPELFSTAGMFDGTHFYANVDCSQVDTVRDTTFSNAMFDPVFGNPRDASYAALNNGPTLVCNATPEAMQSIHWFVQYGAVTSEPNDANYFRGDHLMQKLQEKGVTNEISPAVLAGGHHWATADEHMRQTLPLHWSALGQATYPKPDLVITNLAVSPKTKRKPVSLTAKIANIGADAASGVTVRFYDNQIGLGDFTAPINVPAGSSASVTMPWPDKPEKGQHLIGALVDLNNTVEEENEQNNWARRTVTFKGGKVSNGALQHP
ncbi:MAG: hypothetical protein QOG48_1358 [Verrucomicrobiota bacterium]